MTEDSNVIVLVVPYFTRLLHTRAECVFTWLNSLLHKPPDQRSKIYRYEKAFIHGMVDDFTELFNASERENLQATLSKANWNEIYFIIEKILRNVQGYILSLHAPYFVKAILEDEQYRDLERSFNSKSGICSAKTMLNDLNVGLAVVRSPKNLNEIYRGYPQINDVELFNMIAESEELRTGVSKCIKLVKIRPEFQNYLWHILRTGTIDEQLLEPIRQRHQPPQLVSTSGSDTQLQDTNGICITQLDEWALRVAEVTKKYETKFNEKWKYQAQEIMDLKKLLCTKSNELDQVRGELLTMSYELTRSTYNEIETRKVAEKYKDLYFDLKRKSSELVKNSVNVNNLKPESVPLDSPLYEIQQSVTSTQDESSIVQTDVQKRPRYETGNILDEESNGLPSKKRNRLSEEVSADGNSVEGIFTDDAVRTPSPPKIYFAVQDNCKTVKPLHPFLPSNSTFDQPTSSGTVERSFPPYVSEHHQTIIDSMDSNQQPKQVTSGNAHMPALQLRIVDCENDENVVNEH